LSVLIRERDTAWAKARQSDSDSDWIRFRQLRNKCTVAIRQAKADYFIAKTTTNLKNPKLFWQNLKYIAGNKKSSDFPSCITMDTTIISDKEQILNHFNKHFIDSGSLFESHNVLPSNNDFISAETIFKNEEFTFVHIKSSDVHKALKALVINKSPGPESVENIYLKMAADIISTPLTYLLNLSIDTGVIPEIWKSAFVTPLFKGGDPKIVNNYRPISKLCILSKILESLIN